MIQERVKNNIREIPDFPKPGINFKDITPLLKQPDLCKDIADFIVAEYSGDKIDCVLGVESRGFLFGLMIAQKLGVPFVTARKKGKLPYKTISYSYELEYGTAEVELHEDALETGQNVLIHDDLLATGGTAAAASELVKMLGGKIAGFAFILELSALNGKKHLKQYSNNFVQLVTY